MARYKVTKDQLERIVENFVMEASIESKKAPVKNMIPSQGAEAKKHVKNKMSGNMVDHSEGMPSVTPMKKKLSQASDAKKHMSKAGMKHTNKAKVVKEEEEMGSKSEALDAKKVWDMIKKDIPKAAAVAKGNVDHMAEPLTEEDESMATEAKTNPAGFLNKRLIPRLRTAVKELGAENPDGTINLEVLKDKSKRQKLIGKVLMGLGISTSVIGIATTAITWLLKTDLMTSLSTGTANNLVMSGFGALILGGIIAAIGQPKSERGASGERAAAAVEKSMK